MTSQGKCVPKPAQPSRFPTVTYIESIERTLIVFEHVSRGEVR